LAKKAISRQNYYHQILAVLNGGKKTLRKLLEPLVLKALPVSTVQLFTPGDVEIDELTATMYGGATLTV